MQKYTEEESLLLINKDLNEFPQQIEGIKYLDIRRNKLKKLDIPNNSTVEYLDASDNLIRDLENISALKSLKILDLGYNLITKIPYFKIDTLEELYMMANDIFKIENIEFPSLKKLDLANNEIKILENIFSAELEEIYLGANDINKIADMNHLKSLTILDLQYNKLKELDCALLPKSIEVLLLQENKDLKFIRNLGRLKDLRILGIKNTRVSGIQKREELEIW